MYKYIIGKKIYVGSGEAVLDNNGIGYRFFISDKTAGALLASAESEAKLYTYLNVREDAMELYGFHSEDELNSFKMLITVSGIGAKAAVSVLSVLSPEKLAISVLSDDAKAIAAAQGIGLKKAQKIILEIKDKIAKDKATLKSAPSVKGSTVYDDNEDDCSEAVNALIVLGYTPAEAASAVSSVDTAGKSLEKIIKEALKKITEDKNTCR